MPATSENAAAIRLGIIGVGGIARHHIGQILPLGGVTITALCDIDPSHTALAVERFPKVADAWTCTDYKDLLARADVDAVLVCTPHTQHTQQLLDAMDAGKHILMEKPMVCKVEDAHTILERLKSYDKVVALAYQRHAQGQFIYMREKIASGELGAVTFLSALQCQGWKKRNGGFVAAGPGPFGRRTNQRFRFTPAGHLALVYRPDRPRRIRVHG